MVSAVPVLQGLRTDHKPCQDPTVGPPCRPLLSAVYSPNAPLSNLLARTLRGVGDELAAKMGTAVASTEGLMNSFDNHNQSIPDSQDEHMQCIDDYKVIAIHYQRVKDHCESPI